MRYCTVLAFLILASACGGKSANNPPPDDALNTSDIVRRDVSFPTPDGVMLTGYVTHRGNLAAGAPIVLLVHQFQEDDEQWGAFPEALAERDWLVLAFNLRGHGDSEPYDGSLTGILTDPNAAPTDIDGAINLATGDQLKGDKSRIGIVGTSIGANLAIASAIKQKAKTYVAVSARKPPTESLAGATATGMGSVLYLAGENDPGGQATDAQAMYEVTLDPRGIFIYKNTTDHGIALLRNQMDAQGRITTWLTQHL